MRALTTHTFSADDGVSLRYHEVGSGRPVVLLHGYMLPAVPTWVDTGIAERLAADGRRVIMLDMRGHGGSVPADDTRYPKDALSSDALALVAHLDLGDYDLGGYSLGARVVARVLTLGAAPRRGFIGGTGLEPIIHATGRGENYRRIFSNPGTFEAGTSEAQLERFVQQIGADPAALIRVLDTVVDTPRGALAQVEVPTLVIAGDQDSSRGSVEDLATLLPHGCLHIVPGDHFSALTSPELVDHLVRFLSDHAAS